MGALAGTKSPGLTLCDECYVGALRGPLKDELVSCMNNGITFHNYHCIAPSIHIFKAKLLNNLKIDRRHWKQIAILFFSLDDGCKEAASGIMQMFNWVSTCKMTEAQHATGLWYFSSDETSKWKSVVGSCEGDMNMENIFPEQLNNFTLFWYNRYWCSA